MTTISAPTQVRARDGELRPFDPDRIATAILAAYRAVWGTDPPSVAPTRAREITDRVVRALAARDGVPTVEQIQDVVELVLQAEGEYTVAKHYILYREQHRREREEKPIPEEVRAAFTESDQYFPTPLQKFQFYDKYSRFSYELGRRETWVETVDRLCDQLWRLAMPYGGVDEATRTRIRTAVLEMKVAPSMRLMAMAGPAFERQNACQYNCTYLPIDDIAAFGEVMLLSMSGCGVGYSVEADYVHQLPHVARQHKTTEFGRPVHTVADSTEGWITALSCGLQHWFYGSDVRFNYELIRPAGTPLRTKGGRASGPTPLKRMLDFIRARILARQGGSLSTVDVHDIVCAIGQGVVSGGVRRTAMISLFDHDDLNMLTCKSGDFERDNAQRWNANNSTVWPPLEQLGQEQFVGQMMEMVRSGRGEPGIFSRSSATRLMPTRRSRDYLMGTNPCFTGETRVWTIYGPRRFDELVGQEVPVLTQLDDGTMAFRPMRNIAMTRHDAPVYRVTVRNNYGQVRHRHSPKTGSFTATGDHVVFRRDGSEVRVADLTAGDRLSSVYRSVANQKGYLRLDNGHESDMEHRIVASYAHGSRPVYPEFHVDHKDDMKWNNDPDNLQVLPHDEHNRLNMVGDLNPMRRLPEKNHFKWDRYQTSGFTGRRHSEATRLQMSESHKRRVVNHEVVSVEFVGRADVYDGTVDDTHKFYIETEENGGVLVHNCGEIVLRPYGMCNLTDILCRGDDSPATLLDKADIAAIIGTIQSLGTKFPGLRPIWEQTAREERLLGVGLSGQMDIGERRLSSAFLTDLRERVVVTNAEWARKFGIKQSAATTTVKPSGNSSQLYDVSSGLHARWAPYYIRNVRVSASSAIARVLKDAGAPMSPENGDDPINPRTWVVSFPVKAPDGAVCRSDRSAVAQCNWWLVNKTNWTEHNPSVTITYRPHEIIDLMKWVWDHREYVGGMAFLPISDAKYDQLPYIEISRVEYERRMAEFPDIDFSKVYRYESEDFTQASMLSACDGPVCELDS